MFCSGVSGIGVSRPSYSFVVLLGGVFLWEEMLVIDVESMFDALVDCIWVGEKCH